MTSQEFERLLSARPAKNFNIMQPCIRDLIFDHFEEGMGKEKANELTKLYTDELFIAFVNRTA